MGSVKYLSPYYLIILLSYYLIILLCFCFFITILHHSSIFFSRAIFWSVFISFVTQNEIYILLVFFKFLLNIHIFFYFVFSKTSVFELICSVNNGTKYCLCVCV